MTDKMDLAIGYANLLKYLHPNTSKRDCAKLAIKQYLTDQDVTDIQLLFELSKEELITYIENQI